MDLALAIAVPFAAIFLLFYFLSIAYVSLYKIQRLHCSTDVELGQSDARLSPTNPNPLPAKDSICRFKSPEIDSLTANFTTVIGEGGFSTVYLARLQDSTLAAVKVHNSSHRLHRAFRQELDVLLRVNHPHIVRLLGYCDDKEEGILVFEYVPNGTLHDLLHSNCNFVLPWSQRVPILFRIATVLDYLHEGCDLQIIHGDIKSSNVLLDKIHEPKLCDFGLARMGFSATVTRSANQMMGSLGYVDPHYLRTGMISKKNDVYSFGVLVLELVTGMEAFDSEKERLLTTVIRPMLHVDDDDDAMNVGELVDQKLGDEYEVDEVLRMTEIAVKCIAEQPAVRPSMAEVVKMMREKVCIIPPKVKSDM